MGTNTLTARGTCIRGYVLRSNPPTCFLDTIVLWSPLFTGSWLVEFPFSHLSVSPVSTGVTLACSPLCPCTWHRTWTLAGTLEGTFWNLEPFWLLAI